MSNEELQILIAEFNRQFDSLKKDLNSSIEKMSDKMVFLGEANISCAKDIQSTREWCGAKVEEMEKDIDGIGQKIKWVKNEIEKTMEDKIKTANLSTRLMIAGSYVTGLTALLIFLANKFI